MATLDKSTKYSEVLAEAICERLANGESMRKICASEEMPNRSTVMRWLGRDAEFASKYAYAKEQGADVLLDEMQEIEELTLSGAYVAAAAKVVLSSMQWRMAKIAPKKYGTKSSVELAGADGEAVQLSDADRVAQIAAILALAQARKEGGEQGDEQGDEACEEGVKKAVKKSANKTVNKTVKAAVKKAAIKKVSKAED